MREAVRIRRVLLTCRVAAVGSLALACLALTIGPAAAITVAPSATTTVLTNGVLPWLSSATRVGHPPATSTRTVGVALASRDERGLSAYAAAVANPKSPLYRQYLTPSGYAARFGAPAAATDALVKWLKAGNLSVTDVSKAGNYVEAKGTVAQLESRFATSLATFRLKDMTFTANTVAPRVPANIGVKSVIGLEDQSRLHTFARHSDVPVATAVKPSDLWSIYHQPANNTGQGESLTLFGWGASDGVETDLRGFEAANQLPGMPFTAVTVGVPGAPDTLAKEEWDLDAQASSGMAPGAQGINFYFVNSGNLDLMTVAIQRWVDDASGSQQASGSFGSCEAFQVIGTFAGFDAALQQAFLEGRTFFASSGDNGSGCSLLVNTNGVTIGPVPSQEFPATSAWATAVGGTSLYTDSSTPPKRTQELAWDYGGGGPAYFEPKPDWQQTQLGQSARCLGDAHTWDFIPPDPTYIGVPCRGVVDVSAVSAGEAGAAGSLAGDGGYNVFYNGAMTPVGGTSLSAPLWHGMWARLTAARATTAAAVGPAAPLTYQIGNDPTRYANDFYDVQVGSNGLYPAAPGWDYPTGWGVPDVTNLVTDVSGSTAPTHPGVVYPIVTPGSTPSAPPCPQPAITDPAGDATQLVIVDTGAAPLNDAAADITHANLTWDPTARALTATIDVADLSAHPGAGSIGENYRFDFTYRGAHYEIEVSHALGANTTTAHPVVPSLNDVRYFWGVVGTTGVTSLGDLTGSMDVANNRISVLLPASAFTAASQPALVSGGIIGGLSVLGQRDDLALTLTADNAAPTPDCAITLP